MVFNYPPRNNAWQLISAIDEQQQATMPQALELIQEALYCIEGNITPIQQPATSEQGALVNKAFSIVHDAFLNYHY